MRENGTSLHFNVCTGAQVELTLNSGDKIEDNRDLRIILENEIEKNQSLIRQLHFSQQSDKDSAVHRQALLGIRANLDEIGMSPEASTEYNFLQFIDKQLTAAGYPPRLLPVVTESEANKTDASEDIFKDDEIPF